MTFTTPWALLLLLALPLLLIIAWPRRHPLRRWRETAALVVRSLIILLLALALAGTRQVQTSPTLATVFLLDVSDSVGQSGREAGLTYIRQALAAMGPEDRAGVVLFGADALVERPVSANPTLADPTSIPLTGYTDIAAAIRLGLTLLPDDAARRLVILSDGGANLGDARQATQLAQANDVEVSAVALPAPTGVEARLDDLRAPSMLRQGEHFDLTVKIHATAAMNAPLQIFSEGRLAVQQALALQPGDNAFVLPLVAGEPGFTTFQARLAPPQDTFPQNNRLDAFSQVQGPLSVLLATEHPDEGRPLADALRAAGLVVVETGPAGLPADLARLSDSAAVVLVNVPAFKLSPRQMSLLQTYVRDLGRGLVVVGGEESYGPGGYFQTPLEETLPLEMTIEDKQRLPGMTMLMVIDKSGSMAEGGAAQAGGPRKVELAKEAIYRSVDLLVPWDRIGVVAFDNAARWVLEPTPAVNTQEIKNAVGTIRADGGTDILAGLQLAADAIVKESTQVRHIVLLTDGGASPDGIPELTQKLVEQDVTVSVVAIGQGYAPFLEEVARIGGGRFYFTDEPVVIPQIFAQETSLASRSYIVEETFTPQVVMPSPILQGLTGLPPLHGYVATSPKQTALTVLKGGEQQDPLLAQWQYGLGRAVAWTSDAKGQWAADWVNWPGFPHFWTQAVRWTIVEGGGGLETQTRLAGDQAIVTAEAVGPDGRYRNNLDVTLSVIDPNLAQQSVPLRQTAPGLYEGAFRPQETGVYLLSVAGQAEGQTAVAQTTGFVLAYSPEYRAAQVDAALLPDLATIGDGRLLPLDRPAEALAHTLPPATGATDLWPWFFLVAILLLPLDVGLRRVIFNREDVRQLWARIQRWLPQRWPKPPPQPSSAGRLLKIKERSPDDEQPVSQANRHSSKTGVQTNDSPIWPTGEPASQGTRLQDNPPQAYPDSKPEAQPESDEGSTVQRLIRAKQKRKEEQGP